MKRRFLILGLFCFVLLGMFPRVQAEEIMNFSSIFGGGMVLQQNRPVNIFGEGKNGDSVTVVLKRAEQEIVRQTGTVENGRWCVTLPAQSGSFEEYTIEATAGSVTRAVQAVVFGEVWIAGGQSNMEWTLQKTAQAPDWAQKEHNGKVRFFVSVGAGNATAQNDITGYWIKSISWDAASLCSGIGYMFAFNLSDELGVPVGIINTAQGATRFSTWIGQDILEKYPEVKAHISQMKPRGDDGEWDSVSMFYNTRIAPLRGYQAAGILWYQGEAEIERGNIGILEKGIPLLVEDWSGVFGNGKTLLPFLSVQVASFSYSDANLNGTGYTGGSNGTVIPNGNAAMNRGVEKVNAVSGKALSIPIYDVAVNLREIHPPHKEEVAAKLTDAALGMVYNKKELYSGPRPVSATFDGQTVQLVFENVGDGLKASEGEQLIGFCLDDTVAEASIHEKNTLTFSTTAPVSTISYAFSTRNQDANLVNSGGYYALAFQMPVETVSAHPTPETLLRPADGGDKESKSTNWWIPLLAILGGVAIVAEAVVLTVTLCRSHRSKNTP